MPNAHPDAPNPFQAPLRLPAEGDSHVPAWRLALAGMAGSICGGLAGDLLASVVFGLAFRSMGVNRLPLALMPLCAALGALLGAVSGTVAAVRITTAPRLRRWLVWSAGGLFVAGFFAAGLTQGIAGLELASLSVLGGFSGLVTGAICCAFLPRRRETTQEPSPPRTAGARPGGGRAIKRALVGFAAAALLITCLVYQAKESDRRASQGYLGVTYRDGSEAPETAMRQPGIVVTNVARGGSAETAGIRPGDRIVAVDDMPVRNKAELQVALRGRLAGKTVTVGLARDDRRLAIDVQLMDVYAMERAIYEPARPAAGKP